MPKSQHTVQREKFIDDADVAEEYGVSTTPLAKAEASKVLADIDKQKRALDAQDDASK